MSFEFNPNFEEEFKKSIIKKLEMKNVSEDDVVISGQVLFHNWEELDKYLEKLENVNIDSIKESAIKEFGSPPEWFVKKYPNFSEK